MQIDLFYSSLLELGISSLSTNIYISVFQQKDLSVSDLAKKYKVQRWKIYECLHELFKEGLVLESQKYSRSIEIVSPTQVLSKLNQKEFYLKEKISGLTELIPSLIEEYRTTKPEFIKIYKGKYELQNLFDQVLDETDDIIYGLGNFESWLEFLGIEYEKVWRIRRIEKGVKFKALAFPGYLVNQAMHTNQAEIREMKLLPANLSTDGILLISKNKVTQWNPILPRAISIEDVIFNKFFTSIFEIVWALV
jgi:sugar-specific transcriptional regulator TrmB